MAAEALTATEYIKHHMAHLASAHQGSVVDFSIVNYDTIFFSVLMLAVMFFRLRAGAKKATSGVPGKMQCAVEMLVEMVNNQAKNIVHGDRTFVAPLALTVFCWVALMNSIDLIPVDLFPAIAALIGLDHLRPLPTADLNGPLGMSLGVLLLLFYYGVKVKGLGGFALELSPIGAASAGIGQVFAGLVWWLFHVLIVLLQAFIFMMLTLVYIGQAHSSH